MSRSAGRHFLQIPGPTNVPDRVLRAIDFPTMDHRGPDFAVLGRTVLEGMKRVFKTSGQVVIYPASGTGAWEAALVNTLSAGDLVLMYETGHFATLWQKMALKLGLQPEFLAGDWRTGADPAAIDKRLRADSAHRIKAVCVVHNETARCARQSTLRSTPRSSWWTPFLPSLRSITGTTSGVWTSRSAARRKA
jgi:alanine-glyoxylate transaminase/serine-glyoxylate transaminase/serine-pyruvate transaminase